MLAFLERLGGGAATALMFHALRFWRHWLTVWLLVLLSALAVYILVSPPLRMQPITVYIGEGDRISSIGDKLEDAHVVRVPLVLELVLRVANGDDKVRTGTYRFMTGENVFSIARRLLSADYGMKEVKITFPEGMSIREMSELVAATFPGISAADFTRAAAGQEGYLFPDTYVVAPSSDAAMIVATMRKNFDTRVASLSSEIAASKRPLSQLVTMASLLEKEARTEENRRIVAGILWRRIAQGMPLQVDAVFGYIFNRDTYSPSLEDLKVDSPYNTYRNKGLPPTPINSPGLAAILAAAQPATTKYLFYLTGVDNAMHYATTFEGHKNNRALYLK